jgi:hypothetical protein
MGVPPELRHSSAGSSVIDCLFTLVKYDGTRATYNLPCEYQYLLSCYVAADLWFFIVIGRFFNVQPDGSIS